MRVVFRIFTNKKVSSSKHLRVDISLLEFGGGGGGNVIGEFCGETEESTQASRIIYGREETGLTCEPLTSGFMCTLSAHSRFLRAS